MEERKKHIDDIFREGLDGYTETPPTEVWTTLHKRIHEPPPAKKPFPVWWMWVLVGIVAISASSIIASQILGDNDRQFAEDIRQENPKSTQQLDANVAQSEPVTANSDILPVTESKSNVLSDKEQKAIAQNSNNEENVSSTASEANNMNTQEPARSTISAKDVQQQDYLTAGSTKHIPTHSTEEKTNKNTVAVQKYKLPEHQISPIDGQPLKPNQVNIASPLAKNVPAPVLSLPQIEADATKTEQIPIRSKAAMPVDNNFSYSAPVASLSNTLFSESEASTVATQAISYNAAADNDDVLLYTDTSKRKNIPANIMLGKEKADNATISLQDTARYESKAPLKLPISIGIKAGYQRGVDRDFRADKFVVSPFIEYTLSDKLTLLFQPAYLTGKPTTGNLQNSSTSYVDILDSSFNSTEIVVRGEVDSSVLTPNPPDTVFRTYTYTQTIDSVHVSYTVQNRQLWDIELPLILKYKINDFISVFGGGSITYSAVLQTKENVQRYSAMKKEYVNEMEPQTFYVTQPGQEPPPAPDPQSISSVFPISGTPFSTYEPRQVINSSTKTFTRYGFMLGVSATWNDRWMVDLMMHKTGVNTNIVPDKNIQRLYNQPYFRLSVGYKIFK